MELCRLPIYPAGVYRHYEYRGITIRPTDRDLPDLDRAEQWVGTSLGICVDQAYSTDANHVETCADHIGRTAAVDGGIMCSFC